MILAYPSSGRISRLLFLWLALIVFQCPVMCFQFAMTRDGDLTLLSSHQSHLFQQGSPVLCSSQEGQRAELLIVSVLKWEEWLTSHGGISALLFPWLRPQGGAGCAKWVCSVGALTGSSLYHPWSSASLSQKGLSVSFLCWVHSSQRDFLSQPCFLFSLYPHFSLPLLSPAQG